MERYRYIAGVAAPNLSEDRCIGCGRCVQVCPQAVILQEKKRVKIVDPDGCMECGACSMNCPVAAISVNPGVGCAALIISRWLNRIGINSKGCC